MADLFWRKLLQFHQDFRIIVYLQPLKHQINQQSNKFYSFHSPAWAGISTFMPPWNHAAERHRFLRLHPQRHPSQTSPAATAVAVFFSSQVLLTLHSSFQSAEAWLALKEAALPSSPLHPLYYFITPTVHFPPEASEMVLKLCDFITCVYC